MPERTVVLDGLSKSYAMTGWRVGYGLFPSELVEPVTRLMTNSVSCTAAFVQIAAAAAIEAHEHESVESMVSEFRERRQVLVDGLERAAPAHHVPDAGGRLLRLPKHRGNRHDEPTVRGLGYSGIRSGRIGARRHGVRRVRPAPTARATRASPSRTRGRTSAMADLALRRMEEWLASR